MCKSIFGVWDEGQICQITEVLKEAVESRRMVFIFTFPFFFLKKKKAIYYSNQIRVLLSSAW